MPQAEGPTPGPYAAAAHPSWCPSRSIEDTSEIPLVNSPACSRAVRSAASPVSKGPSSPKQPIDQVATTSAATRPDFTPGRASPHGDRELHPTWGVPFSPTVARRRQSPSTRRVCWPALRRLVVLLERVILHRRVVKDLERLGRRPEPRGLQPAGETAGPVLAIHAVGGALHRLDQRPIRALLGGLLVDGQLGQRKRLEPLVGDRSALRTERP
jgi:hypothetical protein